MAAGHHHYESHLLQTCRPPTPPKPPLPRCLQFPAYYTQPFHAYPEGNLAMEPALEMTVAARRWVDHCAWG